MNKIINSKSIIDFISVLITQGSTLLVPLVMMPYVVLYFGLEESGLLILSFSSIMLFNTIFDLGLSTAGMKLCNDNEFKNDYIIELLIQTGIMKLILSLLIVSLLILLSLFYDGKEVIVLIISVITSLFYSLIPLWYFQAVSKINIYSSVVFIVRLIFVLGSLLLTYLETSVMYIVVYNLFSWVLGFLLFFIFARIYNMPAILWEPFKLKNIFIECWPFFKSRLAYSGYSYCNVFFVNFSLGPKFVAVYGISEYVFRISLSFFGSVNQILYPILTRHKNSSDFIKFSFLMMCILLFGLVLVNVKVDYIVDYLYGEIYPGLRNYIFLFSLVSLAASGAMLLGFPAAAITGRYDFVNSSNVFAFILYLISVFIFNFIFFEEINPSHYILILFITEFLVLSIRLFDYIKWSTR